MLFYLVAIVVVAIDQLSKILVRYYLAVGGDAMFWGIHMSHYENSGMARSLFQGYGQVFAIFAVIFVAGVLYYRSKGRLNGLINDVGYGFLVGGAVGNAIDRILFGKVTDFLVSFSGRGILNLADHAINIGILFIIIGGIIEIWKKKISYKVC
jgi:signal peptidase II